MAGSHRKGCTSSSETNSLGMPRAGGAKRDGEPSMPFIIPQSAQQEFDALHAGPELVCIRRHEFALLPLQQRQASDARLESAAANAAPKLRPNEARAIQQPSFRPARPALATRQRTLTIASFIPQFPVYLG